MGIQEIKNRLFQKHANNGPGGDDATTATSEKSIKLKQNPKKEKKVSKLSLFSRQSKSRTSEHSSNWNSNDLTSDYLLLGEVCNNLLKTEGRKYPSPDNSGLDSKTITSRGSSDETDSELIESIERFTDAITDGHPDGKLPKDQLAKIVRKNAGKAKHEERPPPTVSAPQVQKCSTALVQSDHVRGSIDGKRIKNNDKTDKHPCNTCHFSTADVEAPGSGSRKNSTESGKRRISGESQKSVQNRKSTNPEDSADTHANVGRLPIHTFCDNCEQDVWTTVKRKPGVGTYLTSAGLCVVFPQYCGGAWPFCCNLMYDSQHVCPSCKKVLTISHPSIKRPVRDDEPRVET